MVLAILFDLSAIASIGSAVALVGSPSSPSGTCVLRADGRPDVAAAARQPDDCIVLVAFALTTLVEEPGTAVALVAILLLGIVLDFVWKRRRNSAHV